MSKGIPLTPHQRLSWLQLIRSENVGPIGFRDLIRYYGSADNALAALPDLAGRTGKRAIRIASRQQAEDEMAQAEKLGIKLVGMGEPDYPPLLKLIDAPPPLLAVKGNLDILQAHCVAFVGSRNASVNGCNLTTIFAKEVGQAGFVTVSGLARGIDAYAHRASIDTGTIAAMAGGIDRLYPQQNHGLMQDIVAKGGALISEMPLGWEPRAQDFPRRNRLIAGLSHGLVVIEAAYKSGSLISARYANDFGRIVMAAPGFPLDPRSAGTNNLIRNGAILVSKSQHIIEALTPMISAEEKQTNLPLFSQSKPTQSIPQPPLAAQEPDYFEKTEPLPARDDEMRISVLQALSTTPIAIDALLDHLKLSLPQLNLASLQLVLLELELGGKILRHSSGMVALNATR